MSEAVDLRRSRNIHIVGVGGVGMAPIAGALAAMGHRVTGSDHLEVPILDQVRAAGVRVIVGHAVDNIPTDVDVVAYSTAVPLDNIEIVEASRRAVMVVHRSQLLAAMAATKPTIGVAGTHGKTTTSAMITHVLSEMDTAPSFVIGGDLVDRGLGAAWKEGGWFVVEADESDGSGFTIPCAAIIVTNIEPDHLEFHGTVDNLHRAFADFMASTDGPRVVCADDPVAGELGSELGARTYGTSAGAHYRIIDPRSDRGGSSFGLAIDGIEQGTVRLPVPGIHNIRNATAALAVLGELGLDMAKAMVALGTFAGVSRRFQFRGERNGITFVDDFAHLPTEIAAAVAAAHDGGWGRVIAVFQPHRYSRTESLWREFADAFIGADELIGTDVYAAAEAPRPGVTGMLIVDAVSAAHPDQSITYVPERSALAAHLAAHLQPGDLCLTIGAGDITRLSSEIIGLLDGDEVHQ